MIHSQAKFAPVARQGAFAEEVCGGALEGLKSELLAIVQSSEAWMRSVVQRLL